MFVFITWPNDFSTQVFTVMGSLTTEFMTPLTFVMGVLCFVVVIAVLIKVIHN